jgi:hypothetical protein
MFTDRTPGVVLAYDGFTDQGDRFINKCINNSLIQRLAWSRELAPSPGEITAERRIVVKVFPKAGTGVIAIVELP